MLIASITTLLETLFLTLDCLFSFVYYPYKLVTSTTTSVTSVTSTTNTTTIKTIAIVGGSFGGLAALRVLQEAPHVRVILIDQREYYEYVPGVLRLFCNPELHKTICRPMPSLAAPHQFVHGTAMQINRNNVVVKLHSTATTTTISFDHVIIATGADYRSPITPTEGENEVKKRYVSWREQARRLKQAQSVLVLGGGAVGTELAAEIVCHFPEKQVTIVDAQKKLVPLFPSKTSDHVASWFQKKGTRLVLGEMLETIDEQGCTTKKGQRIEADVVFVCFGMKCNTQAVAKGDMVSSDRSILDQRGAVVVNECLQVPDYPNVFAVGDAMVHPSLEIKQAYYAEMNGTAAAHNVLALVNGTTLLKYPESISNASISPLVYVVSLGRYDGSLGFNGVVVNGAIAAVVKWVLEWTKVRQMEGRPIGLSVWAFGDALTIWMSNHLIRPAKM